MENLRGTISSRGSLNGKLNGLEKIQGYSAYQVAVINGFVGTEAEWLESLKGAQGDPGKPGAVQTVNGILPDESGNVEIPAGLSPTLTVEETDGGHKVTISDADGEKEFVVTDGKDGYTPVKGKDYFDGEDGYTPVKGVDYFDGQDGYTPRKGVDYFDGKDGTSVTVASVTESTEDGGVNVVTFSDGNTLNVRNGSRENFENTPVNFLILIDQSTGKHHTIYVDNGKLTKEEVV